MSWKRMSRPCEACSWKAERLLTRATPSRNAPGSPCLRGGQPPLLDCGGKRSATPLWIELRPTCHHPPESEAPSPLRSTGALQSPDPSYEKTPAPEHPPQTPARSPDGSHLPASETPTPASRPSSQVVPHLANIFPPLSGFWILDSRDVACRRRRMCTGRPS